MLVLQAIQATVRGIRNSRAEYGVDGSRKIGATIHISDAALRYDLSSVTTLLPSQGSLLDVEWDKIAVLHHSVIMTISHLVFKKARFWRLQCFRLCVVLSMYPTKVCFSYLWDVAPIMSDVVSPSYDSKQVLIRLLMAAEYLLQGRLQLDAWVSLHLRSLVRNLILKITEMVKAVVITVQPSIVMNLGYSQVQETQLWESSHINQLEDSCSGLQWLVSKQLLLCLHAWTPQSWV